MMGLFLAGIFLASYLMGSIPSGLLISKSRGIDIREHGSRNIGATNVWRILGKKWGVLAFCSDTGKGWLAVTLSGWGAAHFLTGPLACGNSAGIIGAVGAILGHNFPVWLRFKGGKGVATSLGVLIGLMPIASLIVFCIWGLVLKLSRYVSLASICAAVALPLVVLGLILFARAPRPSDLGWPDFVFALAAAGLVVKRHLPNIQRLRAGTELRFGTKKDPHSSEENSIQ
jgi:glycerol-3-phosphate acyltransferase PlsY